MNQPRIVITRRWPREVEEELGSRYDVQLNEADKPMTRTDLLEAFATADAVLPTVSDPIPREIFEVEPLHARLLGNFGVGFNHIDLEAARAHGVTVTNTPGVLTDCTADLALTLMLTIARRASEGERHVREGAWTGWRPTHMMGAKVTGKTLGIIGMGRIGRAVARRAQGGFGMRLVYFNRSSLSASDLGGLEAEACATVEEVLERSDFVSLHCPGGAETRHLINAERLRCMRPGAFLINTARGDVVDETALAAALKNGAIAGAGLDVYEAEPRVPPELTALENVVLLPHLGSATRETRVAMGMRVLANVNAFFDGEEPPDRVA